ncbi:MAG: histidine--tRNA ligase [Syntrophales bacterium]
MTAQKTSIPKGTRDFGTTEMVRRNYIFDTIRSVFQRYGYKPIETPAMENLSTLLGKYGEEEDKLIYKIRSNKNFRERLSDKQVELLDSIYPHWLPDKSENALRYDLTVPFARYVVMHQNEITFPFKRYQIQPVWRADRPQKGRYREFYQCDVDVIGSDSLLNEVELIQITDEVFAELGMRFYTEIKLNNRKILSGVAEIIGMPDKVEDIAIALDKVEKLGMGKIIVELKEKNIINERNSGMIDLYIDSFKSKISNNDKIIFLKNILKDSDIGKKGIKELEYILNYLDQLKINVTLDYSLARGLNYYTGTIFEVKSSEAGLTSSIAGGGRYDDLTGIFGLPNVSGVGISFGADRIYDAMQEIKLFPENSGITTQLFFVNFGANEEKYCLPLIAEARKKGINTELYPDSAKMKKQLDYANSNNIPYVAIVGSNEMNSGMIALKNMHTGEQINMNFQDLVSYIISRK